ncbi:MAG: YfhO family protein [Acidobacteria bacterium]|nr:YfhO family protein [Acidobacteriota bacterium]
MIAKTFRELSTQPRVRNLFAVLFLISLPPIFFWRETLGLRTLGDKDAVFWFFPAYKFVAEQIKSGMLPLWNPYQYSGAPMFAEWQAGALDPINWIYLIEMTSRTLTLSLEISFAIALLATFSYTRSLGFNRHAAIVSAVIYGLSGFAVGRSLYPGFLRIVALAPFVLYFVEKLYQQGRWRYVAGGALIVAWQVFAAHPQPLVYSSLLACAYALFCALFRSDGSQSNLATLKSKSEQAALGQQEPRIFTDATDQRGLSLTIRRIRLNPLLLQSRLFRFRLIFLAKFALMFIGGACLSAAQLLPAAEFASQSVRREWPFELFTLHSLHPLSLLTTLFPFFHGEGRGFYRMPYWGVYWHHNEAQIYLGAIALSLAIAGAVFAWRARLGVGMFWICAAIIGVVLAFGKFAGPVAHALYHVPVIGAFRSPNRHWMEVALGVAVLAGYAVDRLLNEESRLLARVAQIAALSLATLCVAVGAFVLWRKDLAEAAVRALSDLGHAQPGVFQTAGAEFYLPMIISVGALAVIAVFTRARRRSHWFALLLALLIIDYHLYAVFAPITNPARLETLVGTAMPQALAAKQSEREPIRYHISLDPASGEFSPFWFYGSEMVTGYDPVLSARYKTFSGVDEAGRTFISSLFDPQDQTLDLLNTRYVFAPSSRLDPDIGAIGDAGGIAETATKKFQAGQVELRPGRIAVFKTAASGGDSLVIVSSLSNSAEIADEEEVAEVTVNCGSGPQWSTALRAGRDTSEWAYDRADVRSVIKHSRAKIAENRNGDASSSFQAHSYLARIELPENLRACQSPRTVQVKAKARGVAAININQIAFKTAAPERSITLAPTAHFDQSRWREVEQRSETKAYRDFRIFENLRSMPRAWLAHRVKVAYEGDQLKLIRGELGDSFDPRTTALLDHETAATLNPNLLTDAEEYEGEEPKAQKAEILERRPARMLIETASRKPAVLVLSEIAYPGWRVTIDGFRSELLRVNYNLRGVALPEGSHRIELTYSPVSLKVGTVVSITTALGLLLIVLWEKRRAKWIKDADVV